MGSQMSFARKIGLKSLILDKNAQNWPNLGSLGPHKSKTAYGMTIFFAILHIFVRSIPIMVVMVKNLFKGV